MKTAFTFKNWYWGDEDQPPQWWTNFRKAYRQTSDKELSRVAKVREKTNGDVRVVFNDPNELAFFILRWS
jgi:hypothetical protein